MPDKRILWLTLGSHLLVLVMIYLPFAVKPMQSLEIIFPAMLNLLLIFASFVVSLILTIVPAARKYCGYWWLSFGAVLLVSFPACLGTMQISAALVK